MNFTTDPRKLASAVSWAARRVPSKPEQPILGGMLIEFNPKQSKDGAEAVRFSGFDFEVSTTATLVPDDFLGFVPGRWLVSGRLLAELVKSLPPKPATLYATDAQMILTCGPVRASLPLMPAEDYPTLPTSPEPVGTVDMRTFAREVGRVLPACDISGAISQLPALAGVYVQFGDHGLIVTASNRYQLATNTVTGWQPTLGAAEQSDFPILIPGSVLGDVLKVCDTEGSLRLGVSGSAVSFDTGQRVIVSRLLDAKAFPAAFANRIPTRAEAPTAVDVDEVTTALKRAVMVLDDAEPVSLTFDHDVVTMLAGSGRGQISARLDCDHAGPEVAITVNPAYFETALTSTGGTAELTINGPTLPILVTAPKDDAYAAVVMPIRSQS